MHVRVSICHYGDDTIADGELTGDSATAAAARGLWYLWHGRTPDDRVIVVAAIDPETFNVMPVDDTGLELKVTSILKLDWFDTIVVANADNQYTARKALHANDKMVVIDLNARPIGNGAAKPD
jgi:hypothetical protein